MLKSKLASIAAAAALSFGAMGAAQADVVITAGDYRFTLSNYDSGTTGYGLADPACTSVISCDAAAGSVAPGSVGSVNTSADTMGIFRVESIQNTSNGTFVFQQGADGYLSGVFGGLMDYLVGSVCSATVGCTTTAFATGGEWAMYWSATDTYDPTLGPAVGAGKDLNALLYPGISGGELWLSGVFAPGVNTLQPDATYVSVYGSDTIHGNGYGLLDVYRGAGEGKYAEMFDTNGETGGTDMRIGVEFYPKEEATQNGWTVISSATIVGEANAIPEPSTMALAGLALLGAGLASRRRKS